jgi:hypothetical protein
MTQQTFQQAAESTNVPVKVDFVIHARQTGISFIQQGQLFTLWANGKMRDNHQHPTIFVKLSVNKCKEITNKHRDTINITHLLNNFEDETKGHLVYDVIPQFESF